MDKKDKELYSKAIEAYGDGELDKALSICEKGISKNLKNAPLLNLKGLLLYLNGKLKEAQGVWKLNKDTNKDAVAARYLENINEDWDKYILYKEAVALVDKVKIHAAEQKLLKCSESSFNQIAVSNLLSLCYLKKGEYDKSKAWLKKAISIDKHNKDSLMIKKELITIGVEKKEVNFKPIMMVSAAALFAIMIGVGTFNYVNVGNNTNMAEVKTPEVKVAENKPKEEIKGAGKQEQEKKQEQPKQEQPKQEEKKEQPETTTLPNIQEIINKKDYLGMYDYLTKTKNMNLSENDKILRGKAEEILKAEGSEILYRIGSNNIKAKKYGDAINMLNMAEEYGEGNYFYGDAIYLKAYALENAGNLEGAAQEYMKYIDKYPKGDYAAESLYKLANTYKNTDKQKAKTYAAKIVNEFPDSMYNNSTTQSILK